MIKIRRNRLLFCFFPYFCDRIKATCVRTYFEIKEALCLSRSRERRKFKTIQGARHSGSHAIAWAAISISLN